MESAKTFKRVDAKGLKSAFPTAFEIDPNLSPREFYEVLASCQFNREEAYNKVQERLKDELEFWVPRSPSPSPPKPRTRSSRKGRSSLVSDSPHCVENSDDPARSSRKRPSPSKRTPVGKKGFKSHHELDDLLLDSNTNSLDEDFEDVEPRGSKRYKPAEGIFATPSRKSLISSTPKIRSSTSKTPSKNFAQTAPNTPTAKPGSQQKFAVVIRSVAKDSIAKKKILPSIEYSDEDGLPSKVPAQNAPVTQMLGSQKLSVVIESNAKGGSTKKPPRPVVENSDDDDFAFNDLRTPAPGSQKALVAFKSKRNGSHKKGKFVRPVEYSDEDLSDTTIKEEDESTDTQAQIPLPRTTCGFKLNEDGVYVELSEAESEPEEDEDDYYFRLSSDSEVDVPSVGKTATRAKPSRRQTVSGYLDNAVLKHRIETKTTPWIRKLAGTLFNRTLEAADVSALEDNDKATLINITSDPAAIRKVAWDAGKKTKHYRFQGNPIWEDFSNHRVGYSSAIIEDIKYKVGDYCVVRAPSDEPVDQKARRKSKAFSDSEDDDSDDLFKEHDPWFARIISMFEDSDGEEICHFQWLTHGSNTILKETAGPHELMLLDQCDDSPMASIFGKIEVDWVGDEDSSFNSETVETQYKGHKCFYRFSYHEKNESFTHAPPPTKLGGRYCVCCEQKRNSSRLEEPAPIGEVFSPGSVLGFEYRGVEYRVHEFVYVLPEEGGPYIIGQILGLQVKKDSTIKAEISLFDRFDEQQEDWWRENRKGLQHNTRDNRRLIWTRLRSFVDVDRIEGKCRVRHIDNIQDLDDYKDKDDQFWVKEKCVGRGRDLREVLMTADELKYSENSEIDFATEESLFDQFRASVKPLAALELFAGCGGMSVGLHQSGIIDTKWAIEFAPAAARTFKRNLPEAEVYNEDCNICLERAIKEDQNIDTSEYRDISDNHVSSMPKRGEVELICAGFPCPGYSGINRAPKADDIKNTLITMTLSFVDFYRPKYVLLENVTGLLRHRLGGTQNGKHSVVGGIERGTLKFIMRALTSMGYSCQYTTLQSGEYGVPQSRQRVIFWAAARGYDLPKYPQPKTTWSASKPKSWHRIRNSAPHPEVTVGDAVTDLPKYEWVNPHKVLPQTPEEKIERLRRSKTIRQVEIKKDDIFAGSDIQPYASQPLSEFQRKLRKGVPSNRLTNHVSKPYYDRPVKDKKGTWRQAKTEQVCNIAMKPGANHQTMPFKIKPWCLYHEDSAAERHKWYPLRFGRLEFKKPFQTCLTDTNPNGKNGNTLHPTQHRVISIRETARAQGFPDSFSWDLEDVKPRFAIRMIGNAVPVPLAEALGEELFKTLFQAWLKEREKEENWAISGSFKQGQSSRIVRSMNPQTPQKKDVASVGSPDSNTGTLNFNDSSPHTLIDLVDSDIDMENYMTNSVKGGGQKKVDYDSDGFVDIDP